MNQYELKVLNNIVSGYFDFAEIQAIRHRPMYMEDYIKQLDGILSGTGERLTCDLSGGQMENVARKYSIKAMLHGDDIDTMDALHAFCSEERLDYEKTHKIGF